MLPLRMLQPGYKVVFLWNGLKHVGLVSSSSGTFTRRMVCLAARNVTGTVVICAGLGVLDAEEQFSEFHHDIVL